VCLWGFRSRSWSAGKVYKKQYNQKLNIGSSEGDVIRPKLLSEVPSEREYHPEGRDCVCECRVSHPKPKRPGNGEFGGLCVNNSRVSSPLMRPPVRKTAVYV